MMEVNYDANILDLSGALACAIMLAISKDDYTLHELEMKLYQVLETYRTSIKLEILQDIQNIYERSK
jgi:hypothetical protein